MRSIRNAFYLGMGLTFGAVLSGCGNQQDSSLHIKNGSSTLIYSRHVVNVSGWCTGTLIGKKTVLTAAHCRPQVGQLIYFYENGNLSGKTIPITEVAIPPGVNDDARDYVADYGLYADLAVLTLAEAIPEGYRPLELGHNYPGGGAVGIAVGSGMHDGTMDSNVQMRYAVGQILSPGDADGQFMIDTEITDPGDSGGPFLARDSFDGPSPEIERVFGVLHGSRSTNGVTRDFYTSVNALENWRFVFRRITN